MKKDEKFCILSVKYSILEGTEEGTGSIDTTEMEHIFVARKKSAVLKKIRRFEERLKNNTNTQKASAYDRLSGGLRKFLDRYRYSYESLLRL
ncbi:hypothetical protein [Robertkochia flava]|uniref:hypothetical protein n=1 Tax=Robertkochia flava TaxID=3447986 RepID=UPI001CCE3CC5|nr:hypothetical protein [Robertkochia marina]